MADLDNALHETGKLPVRAADDDAPPVLGEWRRVYIAVLCYLAVLLTVLTLISNHYVY